jgi:hypothetical protein
VTAVSLGVLFLAYTTGIWAYCLLRGYSVTPGQLFATTWPTTTAAKAG